MANSCSNYITINEHHCPTKYDTFEAMIHHLSENDKEYEPENKDYRWMGDIFPEFPTINCIHKLII